MHVIVKDKKFRETLPLSGPTWSGRVISLEPDISDIYLLRQRLCRDKAAVDPDPDESASLCQTMIQIQAKKKY